MCEEVPGPTRGQQGPHGVLHALSLVVVVEWALYVDDEGGVADDAMFLESSVVLGTEVPRLVLVLDSCSSIELAWERADRRTGLAEEVAEYPKESVRVVRSATPSIVRPMKDLHDGVRAPEWENDGLVPEPCPSNGKVGFLHQLENLPIASQTLRPCVLLLSLPPR